jgi:hypothetical protein
MRLLILALAMAAPGCVDDGVEHVDYITFRNAGTFREVFLDVIFPLERSLSMCLPTTLSEHG